MVERIGTGGLCVVHNGSTGKAQSDVVHLHLMSTSELHVLRT